MLRELSVNAEDQELRAKLRSWFEALTREERVQSLVLEDKTVQLPRIGTARADGLAGDEVDSRHVP